MKPIKASPRKGGKVFLLDLGLGNTIGNLEGFVRFDNKIYPNSIVYLFQRSSAKPVAWEKVKPDGSYAFVGINTNFNYFTTAFDLKKQYVAVSQDNLYPK